MEKRKSYRIYLQCCNCLRPFYANIEYGEPATSTVVACPTCGVHDYIGESGHKIIVYTVYKKLEESWEGL